MIVVADALNIISRSGGAFASRWAHVVVGITWIGLLYYFNFVQVPSYAELSDGARSEALRKLTFRALWWFRYAALLTFLFGITLLVIQGDGENMDVYLSGVGGSGRGGSVASADERRRGRVTAAGAAGELWVRLAMSNPPSNPAPPNRLSAANRSDPMLPGLNRFWSTCIQTKRSVSGEWLV